MTAAKEVLGQRVKLGIDRFPVAQLYRSGGESLRKHELNRLKQTLAEDAYGELKGAMGALGKKDEPLTGAEQHVLGALFTPSPDVRLASEFCQALPALHRSVKTGETHRMQLMARLDIHDVAGLVRYAVRTGVVSADR